MLIEFLTHFQHILHIRTYNQAVNSLTDPSLFVLAEHLIPTLSSLEQKPTRHINNLCELLFRLAVDDPGIPNPKKPVTSLGQKLSDIDITEHTFSEILRLYIRERNGFDDQVKLNSAYVDLGKDRCRRIDDANVVRRLVSIVVHR